VKAVRLTRANGLNERVQGDATAIRYLEDAEADLMVNELKLAVYAPEHDPHPSFTASGVQEIPVVKRENAPSGEQVVSMMERGLTPEEAARELVQLTEEYGLYDDDPVILPGRAADGDGLTQPWTTHSKAKWIEWALHGSHGQPRPDLAEVAGLTKNELMSRYGERL
jgi:hypothetical protein